MSESGILRRIMLALSRMPACRIFRNQVGRYELADGRFVASGLAPGSADLIGWTGLTITPEMVGRTVAVFTSIEVKSERGTVKPHQQNWQAVVAAAGGIALVARSEQEALDGIANALRKSQ